MNKVSALLLASLIGVGGFVAGRLIDNKTDEQVTPVDVRVADEAAGIQRFKIPVTGKEPSAGPADALVTIVEFSEFECPYCSKVLPTTKKIKETYGDKVRIVWRNNPLPFHKNALPAAKLAMEAHAQGGNDKFWKLHDVMFANQKALGRPQLESYAKNAGLDMGKVQATLDGDKYTAAIKQDQALAASIGAGGTPNFFVNGRQVRGAQPFPKFKVIIDEEIQFAESLVKKGTAKDKIYASLTAGGLTKPAPLKPQQRPGQPDPKAVYKVPVTGNEPQKGPSDALVTIVEFSDFECPYCSRVEPTLKQVVKKYGKDVRIVWMNNPLSFHKNALPAANAVQEAHQQKGNAGFWKMHAKFFGEKPQGQKLTRDYLEKAAKESGLNMGQLKAALDKNEHTATIKKQQALAVSLGAGGTPAFFVNGRLLSGARPLPAFASVIDEELKKAKALVAKGTPRSKVYETTIAKGLTKPAPKIGAAPGRQKPDPNKIYKIADAPKAPFKGGANAKIVIHEFSDFDCPYCSRVNPTIAQVLKEYGNKVKIVWRDFPLPMHPDASPAAQAAREIYKQGGNKKFWAYHDLLFANQRKLKRPNLEKFAKQVGGINMAAFKKALDSQAHKAGVDADMKAFTQSGARSGTPAFLINGKLLRGAQPYPAFKAMIDAALKK